jgi:hypothetical protein
MGEIMIGARQPIVDAEGGFERSEEIEQYFEKLQHSLSRQTVTSFDDPGGYTSATVLSVDDDSMQISQKHQRRTATKAFSCLVDPVPGDEVLCWTDERRNTYVLAILSRPKHQDMTLSFPGRTLLASEKGDIKVSAGTVSLLATGQLNLISNGALHQSKRLTVQAEETNASSRTLVANISRLHLVVDKLQTFAVRVLHQAKSYFRQTETDDHIDAGQMIRNSQGLYSVKSKVTTMKSEKDTIIDGDHIFTGL